MQPIKINLENYTKIQKNIEWICKSIKK